MSNNEYSEHKAEPSLHTALKKRVYIIYYKMNIKNITACEIHSQSRSFQKTASHSNQVHM